LAESAQPATYFISQTDTAYGMAVLRIMKTLAAALAALALGNFLCATPPGPGFQHIQFTGIEEVAVPPVPELGPGWSVYTVKKTLSIPSLQLDELVIYVEYTYFEDELDDGPFGAFRMHGVGTIMDADELGEPGVPVGDVTAAMEVPDFAGL
jgi:hypothetical protein